MMVVTTHDMYLDYVIRYHRDRIIKRLQKLQTITARKRFIGIIRKKRHASKTLSKYSDVNFKEFKSIIKLMNNKVCDEVVEGKSFKMSPKLGYIKIRISERTVTLKESGVLHTGVNHGASKLLKQELIKQGKTPIEYFRDKNNKIIGNNGGVEWLVYHTQPIVARWMWFKAPKLPRQFSNYRLNNLNAYYFRPTLDNKRKLNKVMVRDF